MSAPAQQLQVFDVHGPKAAEPCDLGAAPFLRRLDARPILGAWNAVAQVTRARTGVLAVEE